MATTLPSITISGTITSAPQIISDTALRITFIPDKTFDPMQQETLLFVDAKDIPLGLVPGDEVRVRTETTQHVTASGKPQYTVEVRIERA